MICDEPARRARVRRALSSVGVLAISPRATGAREIAAASQRLQPDLVAIDAAMLAGEDTLLGAVRAALPDRPVVAFADGSDPAQDTALTRTGLRLHRLPTEDDGSTALGAFATALLECGSAAPGAGAARLPVASSVLRPSPRKAGVAASIVVVGSSTGGPNALMRLFAAASPRELAVPVLVVQHMPATFTPILATHITRATGWTALEAEDNTSLKPGEIRIAPGGKHLSVAGDKASPRLALSNSAPVNYCRPSADVLFVSAAKLFGRQVVSVILTGMGSDGCEGAKVIASAGGTVLAQDRATSVVWGMPGAAVTAGVVNRCLPIDELGAALVAAVNGRVPA